MSSPDAVRDAVLARRDFLRLATAAGVAFAAPALAGAARAESTAAPPTALPAEFPRQSPDMVREVVGVAHGQFDRLRELVDARPALAKATWDWGYGDWESALGAASHVGRRDIAEYLIAKGARPSLFSAAMLGQLAVVRAFVEADPAVVAIPGPHGIPLLAHARAGGETAKAVLDYLESVPGHPERPAGPDDAERAALVGRYVFGPDVTELFDVRDKDGALSLVRGGHLHRGLIRVERGVYYPVGASAVRVTFAFEGGTATALTVSDGPGLVVTAKRAPGS
jgi:hypothetical protein